MPKIFKLPVSGRSVEVSCEVDVGSVYILRRLLCFDAAAQYHALIQAKSLRPYLARCSPQRK
jgi:hypothetical protein